MPDEGAIASLVVLAIEDLDSYGFAAVDSRARDLFSPLDVQCSDPTDVRRLDAETVAAALAGAQVGIELVALWVALRSSGKTVAEVEIELEAPATASGSAIQVGGDGARVQIETRNYRIQAEVSQGVILVTGHSTADEAQ